MSIKITFENLTASQASDLCDYYEELKGVTATQVEITGAINGDNDRVEQVVSTIPTHAGDALTQDSTPAISDGPTGTEIVTEIPQGQYQPMTETQEPGTLDKIELHNAGKLDNKEYPIEVNGVMVDKRGLVWDSRIHGSGKSCLAKTGEWRLAKGMAANPELIATVEAELIASRDGVAGEPAAAVVPEVTEEPATVNPMAAIPAVMPAVEETVEKPEAPKSFPELAAAVTPLLTDNSITLDQLGQIATNLGQPNWGMLQAREDLVPTAWESVLLTVGANKAAA